MRQAIWTLGVICGLWFFMHRKDLAEGIDRGNWPRAAKAGIPALIALACIILAETAFRPKIERASKPKNYDTATLHGAAAKGDTGLVQKILSQGQPVDTPDADGWTPLYAAAYNGHFQLVKLFVEQGADVNKRTKEHAGPLEAMFFAYDEGRNKDAQELESAVRFLVEHGADVKASNRKGMTPLHLAALTGLPNVSALLLDKGADINAVADGGVTPLGAAAVMGKSLVAELLINRGANINSRSRDGRSLLTIAMENGQVEVVRLLKSRGSQV